MASIELPRTVNGTGHTGPSEFCATSILSCFAPLVTTIVEQGATMGIPGSGNSRELSGIPGSDFSLPGSETWENRQNPPVTVDAADASRVLYYGQDLAKQMPQAHGLRS